MRLSVLLALAGSTSRRGSLPRRPHRRVFAIGALDYLTGSALSFAAFYVLVVVAVTEVAGPGPGAGVEVWNGAVRVSVHGLVVLLVTALLRALRAARESEANSRSFLAAAAHQVRTPVAALSASVEALLLEGSSPTQERHLANVAGETRRLGRLPPAHGSTRPG